ncbi:MAG: YkgJ family cysteine cluster protein [Nevskia sp.]|nr:YkgJ family cysteine cluster protein [Nevskia sp.]
MPKAAVAEAVLERLDERRRSVAANSEAIYRAVREAAAAGARGGIEAGLLRELEQITAGNASLRSKLRRLQGLMSRTRAVAAPHVPCRKGCSACCHLQVEISQVEAEMIGEATGRRPQTLQPGFQATPKEQLGRSDTPCPFLLDNACSIYEIRPLVCRNHMIADVDNLLCGFDNLALAMAQDERAVPLPLFDAGPVFRAYRSLNLARKQAWADIRQFFPAAGA